MAAPPDVAMLVCPFRLRWTYFLFDRPQPLHQWRGGSLISMYMYPPCFKGTRTEFGCLDIKAPVVQVTAGHRECVLSCLTAITTAVLALPSRARDVSTSPSDIGLTQTGEMTEGCQISQP